MQLTHDLRKLGTCLHVSSSVKRRRCRAAGERASVLTFTRGARAHTYGKAGGERVRDRRAADTHDNL